MDRVTACDVPEGSLLAGYGGQDDYRDCFCREVAGVVSLADLIERFYCSPVFRPERIVLGLIGSGATRADAQALARGETDRIAVWEVVGRRSGDRKGGVEAEGADGRRPPARATAGPESPDAAREAIGKRSATSGPQGRPPARSDATAGRTSEDSPRGRMAPPAREANQQTEILLLSKDTGTASWLAVEPLSGGRTRLRFGSWVGNLGQSGWRFMEKPHRLYSRMLLGGA